MSYYRYNPNNLAIEELPTIYGFNNGGQVGLIDAVLMAEDGTFLANVCCSDERFIQFDLGLMTGSRPDMQTMMRNHYPEGFKCEFVTYDMVKSNKGLQNAFKRFDDKK